MVLFEEVMEDFFHFTGSPAINIYEYSFQGLDAHNNHLGYSAFQETTDGLTTSQQGCIPLTKCQ